MKKYLSLIIIALVMLLTSTAAMADAGSFNINYRAHVANRGWIDPAVAIGNPVGTTGEGNQLECVEFNTVSLPEGINFQARAHVSNIGWQDFITDNGQIGTTGRGLGIEAVELKFTAPTEYDLYYRTHVRNIGWMGWAKNGETAGTSGFGLPVEAIETTLVPAGSTAPGDTSNSYFNAADTKGLNFTLNGSNGTQLTNGSEITSSDPNLTLDSLAATINSPGTSIAYQANCKNVGWCGWNQDGGFSGNSGNPIEAVQFELHGDLANNYNIFYQVSIPSYGWLDWAKNGEYAGTTRGNLPINGLRVKILPKKAPVNCYTYRSYFEVPLDDYFHSRGIMVSIPLQLVFFRNENNQIVFIKDCTTGTPGTSRETPTGSWNIIKKSRNVTLVGPDYRLFVHYWLPYIGTRIGLHDATWRNDNEFGRDVYKTNGSHGCINMRLNDVAELNNLIRPGDLVVVR